jgi:pheromone shutdown protein TraB
MDARRENLICWILAAAAAAACLILGLISAGHVSSVEGILKNMKQDMPTTTECLLRLGPGGLIGVFALLAAAILVKEFLLSNKVLRLGLTSLLWLLSITLLELVRWVMAQPLGQLLRNLKS